MKSPLLIQNADRIRTFQGLFDLIVLPDRAKYWWSEFDFSHPKMNKT